jgi:hypothetical protein
VLCVGAGGGGDVVGALVVAEHARVLGTRSVLGGVTWERRPIDPLPGPRTLAELEDARDLNGATALAGPSTRGPGGFAFAEARMAGVLGTDTLLVDPNPGPAAVAAGLTDAAARLDCDLLALVDVGGDALAAGHEPGLASPLCDAVLLAAGTLTADAGLATLAAVVGPGCDGELTHDELLLALADVAAAGGLLGVHAIDPASLPALEAAAEAVPTEASVQVLRCARGERGPTAIRNGRRPLELSALGALTVYVEPRAAVASAAALARAVRDRPTLEAANDALHELGVRTELDYERERAATGA